MTTISIDGSRETIDGSQPAIVLAHLSEITAKKLASKRKEIERLENAAIALRIEIESLEEIVVRYDSALAQLSQALREPTALEQGGE